MNQIFERLEDRRLLAITSGFPIALGSSPGISYGREVERFANGDALVAGTFSGTVVFDPASPSTSTLTSFGESDVFVARYSRAGALLWARRFGGDTGDIDFSEKVKKPLDVAINPDRTGGEFVTGVSVDPANAGEYATGVAIAPDGSIYVTGGFRGVASFGAAGSSAANILSTNRNYPDVFLLKLTGAGSLTYARQFGGRFTDIAYDIALDASGNPYLCGQFTRTADFDPTSRTFNLDARGRGDAFAMRLNGINGNLVWVAPMGSDEIDRSLVEAANGIAVDALGNAYITGTFAGKTDFDPRAGKQNTLFIEAVDDTDAFTAKLAASNGNLVWVKTQGGEHFDGGRAITLIGNASNPHVVTAGYFERTIDADPGRAELLLTATPEDPGDKPQATDVLISHLTNAGNLVWAKQFGGGFYETIGRLSSDSLSNIYLTGAFTGTVDFNPGASQFNLRSTPLGFKATDNNEDGGDRRDSYDGYFMSLTPSGTFRFARRFGGSQDEFAIGLSRLNTSEFYITGRFSGTTNLAPPSDGSIGRTSRGKTSIFVELFDDHGHLV
jgi:hypothetical protein